MAGLTKREFLASVGAITGCAAVGQGFNPLLARAFAAELKKSPPVIWFAGSTCGGCSISALNAVNPAIDEIVLNLVTLHYHLNISAASGDMVFENLYHVMEEEKGNYIYVQEGAVPTAAQGRYCIAGEYHGKKITMLKLAADLARNAKAVVAAGVCASYGGIPAAPPNPTGVKPLSEIVGERVINVPGCPVHPDDLFGTLLYFLKNGMPELDAQGRPKIFFPNVHENCPLLPAFKREDFADNWGEQGKCYALLGCRGPDTFCNAPQRGWNSGINWCIKSGASCFGCTQPDFARAKGGLFDIVDRNSL